MVKLSLSPWTSELFHWYGRWQKCTISSKCYRLWQPLIALYFEANWKMFSFIFQIYQSVTDRWLSVPLKCVIFCLQWWILRYVWSMVEIFSVFIYLFLESDWNHLLSNGDNKVYISWCVVPVLFASLLSDLLFSIDYATVWLSNHDLILDQIGLLLCLRPETWKFEIWEWYTPLVYIIPWLLT